MQFRIAFTVFVLLGVCLYRSFQYNHTILKKNQIMAIFSTIKPVPGINSIQEAIERFQIEIPDSLTSVRYSGDDDQYVSGICVVHMNGFKEIVVYESAFESWATLGSTLAHEIEWHATGMTRVFSVLSYYLNPIVRKFEEYGAYSHQVHNARRFGSTEEDIKEVKFLREVVLQGI